MTQLIDPTNPRYHLGIPSMDATHQEFIALVNQSQHADKAQFMRLYAQLFEHTRDHFSAEERLMETTGFPATVEHKQEHLRVLGELNRFGAMVERGSISMARAYVRDHLPGWFELHAITMDSALAAHLRTHPSPSV
jgi:hemerythrin